jgi:hypothetical protein
MSLTPIDAVRAHVRAASLSTLQKAVVSGGAEVDTLRGISSVAVESACFDPELRLWSAQIAIAGAFVDSGTALKLVTSGRGPAGAVSYLGKSSSLVEIVGLQSEYLASDIEAVRRAWLSVKDILEEIGLLNLLQIFNAVDLVAGFLGPRGEIRALSNPLFPGFAAIGINAPPLVIAEQAVHESMHVVVSAHLALNDDLAALIDDSVGILSPFTASVRTIDRVVHGIASYSAVGALWRAAADCQTLPSFLDVSDLGRARRLAERRLETIDARIRLAMRCLFDGAGIETCALTSRFIEEMSGLVVPFDKTAELSIVDRGGSREQVGGLSSIQQAELTMASLGAKVSRISIPLNAIPQVGFSLQSRMAVVCSSWAIRSVADPKLNGFSNTSSASKHILDAVLDDEVHLYLHANADVARKAALLDKHDQAGELFQIPPCCRDWYVSAWPQARNTGGDLFAEMARYWARDGRVIVSSECDASAMYRGGGLCWHFPCSPNCEETVRIVRDRRQLLQAKDPGLLRELDKARLDTITILADGSYFAGVLSVVGSIIIAFE